MCGKCYRLPASPAGISGSKEASCPLVLGADLSSTAPIAYTVAMNLGALDAGILLAYLLGMVLFGVWIGRRPQSSADFMLAGRKLPWWLLLVSIVATETSTVTFLSVPGIAYAGDLTWLQLPIGFLLGRLLVIAILLPQYFRGKLFTAYEVLEQRFGGATQKLASLIFLVTHSLADGLRLFLTAIVLQELAGIPIEWAVLALGGATIVYTFLGGLRAVVWTDFVQFFVYMAGAGLALQVLLAEIDGGWQGVLAAAEAGDKLRLFDLTLNLDRVETLWAGLIGGAVLSLGTHGVDQMMVQRYLAAGSRSAASLALGLSGVLVLFQFALFMVIGLALHAYDSSSGLPDDRVFANFIVQSMPIGARGIVLGAVFAAAMSTLSSSLNSSATTLTCDIYVPMFRPKLSDQMRLRLVRSFTVMFGAIQILVGCAGKYLASSVVNSVLSIAGFSTGMVLGLFLLGLTSRRVDQRAALIGLLIGTATTSYAVFCTSLAWPYYALVGASSTFCSGLIAGRLANRR